MGRWSEEKLLLPSGLRPASGPGLGAGEMNVQLCPDGQHGVVTPLPAGRSSVRADDRSSMCPAATTPQSQQTVL